MCYYLNNLVKAEMSLQDVNAQTEFFYPYRTLGLGLQGRDEDHSQARLQHILIEFTTARISFFTPSYFIAITKAYRDSSTGRCRR